MAQGKCSDPKKEAARKAKMSAAASRQMAKRKRRPNGQMAKHSPLDPKVGDGGPRLGLGIAPQLGPQLDMVTATWMPEIFFGGARGGGKSYALLIDYLTGVQKWGRHWKGVIFRRSYPELKQLIQDSHDLYGRIKGAVYLKKEREWVFPEGARLEFRFLDRYEDVQNYQGFGYQWIGWDELPNWADLEAYDAMKAALRPTGDVQGLRIRATGNPGGAGHMAVKQRFIDPAPIGYTPINDERGERMFIPSSVWDNKILLERDPGYIKRLGQTGPDHLVRAWLYGLWEGVMGAFFDCWDEGHNVVPTFEVPSGWLRYRSFDWGGHAPFSCGWWAVSDGRTPVYYREDGVTKEGVIPSGVKIRYREWYGCDSQDVKKGLRLDNEEIARGILERTPKHERIAFTVTDRYPFMRHGGPPIAEVFKAIGVPLTKGDTDRVSGWSVLYQQLKGGDRGYPMMVFQEHCAHAIRTIPLMQKDRKKIEDVQEGGEDHCPDEIRLAAKVREFNGQYLPSSSTSEVARPGAMIHGAPPLGSLIDAHIANRRRARMRHLNGW